MEERHFRLEDERQRTGRYNLEEAAKLIETEANERYVVILAKLERAAGSGTLPPYMPFSKAQIEYGSGSGRSNAVSPYYAECYPDDLNKWLAKHEPRMSFNFNVPVFSSVPLLPVAALAGLPADDKPISRALAQDTAILNAIRALTYDPQSLPVRAAGMAGVRAEVLKTLKDRTDIFLSTKVYHDAWQRLRDQEDIRDE